MKNLCPVGSSVNRGDVMYLQLHVIYWETVMLSHQYSKSISLWEHLNLRPWACLI